MIFVTRGARRYAQFPGLAADAGLVHAFTTRPQDVSARGGARHATCAANRAQALADWDLDPAALCFCVQVHRPVIAEVTADTPPGPQREIDGLITTRPGTVLMTFSADCPLVLAYDARRRAVGMVHASWRCTVAGAVTRLVTLLQERCGCDPADLRAGIGPSAGPGAYEVQDDVFAAAADLPDRERFFPRRDGRMFFDLWAANADQLVRAGVPASQVEIAGICTMTETETFHSFRREGAGCGHFGLLAALRPGDESLADPPRA